MPYCRRCGRELSDEAKFCPDCGASTGSSNGAAAGNYGYQTTDDVNENKAISILCYFGLFLLIPLLTRPNSAFVKFHSNQGLLLLLLDVAMGAVGVIPILGWIAAAVAGVFRVVCMIIGVVNVCSGEMKELPLIGSIQIIK